MVARKYVNVFEAYDRFTHGNRVTEAEWDYTIIPENAKMMKERYELDFGDSILPTDEDLIDRLFIAGVDMLVTTGIFNPDLGMALTIEEDEIYEGLKMAPKKLELGNGKDKCSCKARRGNSMRKPVIQGGPTGAPVSESIFTQMIESYAQEPTVDTIVSGVLSTVDGHPATTGTPWEIKATMAEVRYCREATRRAGRPGICI